jgi:hypothetical protein
MEDLRFEVDEYRELDEERVLVLGHYIGRGKSNREGQRPTRQGRARPAAGRPSPHSLWRTYASLLFAVSEPPQNVGLPK